ncbi:hypothetical protein [Candidatus Laterigemmans baculatus]|uniref:hypothetical protein n=1 Tax=Candidatus Laterigemmans baculatus TaxID=2770505 RepID=UPI0013DA3032|nr:hypothetical protein [Candidatus Laterigemmans baculatus]
MGKPLNLAAATMLLVALGGGCSMCQQCELDTYSAYGGRWQRTDRDHGRVGSVFAPAGGLVPYDAADDPHAAEDPGDAPELRAPGSAADEEPREGEAGQIPPPAGDSVLQDEAEREAEQERQRRLRELQLEDIRYQK